MLSEGGVDSISVVGWMIGVIVDSSPVLVSVPKDSSVTGGVIVSSVLPVVSMVTAADINVLSSVRKTVVLSDKGVDSISVEGSYINVNVDGSPVLVSVAKDFSVTDGVMVSSVLPNVSMVKTVVINVLSLVGRNDVLSSTFVEESVIKVIVDRCSVLDSVLKDSPVTVGVTISLVLPVISMVALLPSSIVTVDTNVLSSVGTNEVPSTTVLDPCSVVIVIIEMVDNS